MLEAVSRRQIAASGAPTQDAGPQPSLPADLVAQMMNETQQAMTGIAQAANSRTEGIVAELSGLGIRLSLPERLGGVGGPLIAAKEENVSPMIEDANAVARE